MAAMAELGFLSRTSPLPVPHSSSSASSRASSSTSSRLSGSPLCRPFPSSSSSYLLSPLCLFLRSPERLRFSSRFIGSDPASFSLRGSIIARATDQKEVLFAGQVKEGEASDDNILPYCSIDNKRKKTLGELESEFLQALQSFYYDKKAIMTNEEFDNLKEELMWEGSSVVMLSSDEQKLLEASMAYVAGKPILSDAEFDQLKLRLKQEGSKIVQEGPRCSLRSRKVYSDLTVDYFKMFLLNVPAAIVSLTLFFFLDDLTGFEITYIMELPEPFSFIFTWFAALPLIFWGAQSITNVILKDFLILKGPCPNCATENVSFFGTILTVSSGGSTNNVKCSNCATPLIYDSGARLITVFED
ncbi:PGR5-like protein 1B, chloroplastic isoform X1 [Amborella trichopoda]|uniref:PGR5-like protein 1B, chloroplastic isoform X1 n=1 Tax=Amborella trichopoda TaxID=13333 RepID=UPI0009BFA76F|nr:PGR5-like protein 1B, chloroplastic isoform X1 [Amborella trichopoda]|eukprot:XP_020517152.1 PGR5-like protein 1B, chloroplastic isoform X1 [Amborella trichopoda]